MVHLLQVSVVLTTIALIALGLVLYSQYKQSPPVDQVTEIIEIISNQTGLTSSGDNVSSGSVGVGGGETIVTENGTTSSLNISGPQLLILNNNTEIEIVQNEINGTQYTAILFTSSTTN